ncbi:MAG: glycoside hydrolase family 78 protein [Defluviitaleaceae bacterium]|nr:glycoside hydrolase family 78 protein [Defluviitaleaceae bacterium]
MSFQANWIKPQRDFGDVCPTFVKAFAANPSKKSKRATLTITAMGVYEAELNGTRIGDYVLAPGWTTKRLQYQVYDVTHLLKKENTLTITVGRGWQRSPLPGWTPPESGEKHPRTQQPAGLYAQLTLDGEIMETDDSWQVQESPVRFSEIYDGEHYDATVSGTPLEAVEIYPGPGWPLVPQQGDEIREQDRLRPAAVLTTPKGETVIDFGQNMTGYVELSLPAQANVRAGSQVAISFAEVLDKDGNFYTENYRGAKSIMKYTCIDGEQRYKSAFTFYGFRYIRLDAFPVAVDAAYFTAIAVHSDMERTGYIESSHPLINRLFENVIWGQKGNFLDVPTDCPQRDERLGWTGDAQAFIKTAAYNFDVERFFTKWLADLALDQTESGLVHHVIPDVLNEGASAAWADAATICPWEIYLAYGDAAILENQFASMCKWVDYITAHTKDQYLWTGGTHFGDWLALDSPAEHIRGSTRADFLASAFYAHSTHLVVKAGKVLGRDVAAYESLYEHIVKTFLDRYRDYRTQTEHVLALHFGLTGGNEEAVAKSLMRKVAMDGYMLQTGFVGTPYLLHVLSTYGYTKLAYTLLLREEYPSWLYPVTKGATTIWERWDSIKPDGDFQTTEMNSFNHYAYGAVADWIYGVAAGIKPVEAAPGYRKVQIAPQPDARLGWLSASVKTRQGLVRSKWQVIEDRVRYDIETPVPAEICIAGQVYEVEKGCHTFYSNIE